MSNDPKSGRDSPSQWNTQGRAGEHHQYPPPPQQAPGSYPLPPPPQQQTYPALSPYQSQPSAPQTGDMVTLPPPPPSHPQHDMYRGGPMQAAHYDMYQAQAPMGYAPHNVAQQAQVAFSQPAPRQRTAIACRYCRRRKIRCHGFDSNPEGRCTNCMRFHQECIFTPVSSHAHAFVPAHTAYPHLRNTNRIQQTADGRALYPHQGPMLYGAHGQPLQMPPHDPNYPPPTQTYGANPYPTPSYDGRGHPPQSHPDDQVSRKRQRADDPLDPAAQGIVSQAYPKQRRRGSGNGYEYPDPTHMAPISPASSTTSYQPAPYPPQMQPQQPYYPHQSPARRASPQSTYSYDTAARASASPHGSTSSAFAPYPGSLHPPQVLPPTMEGGRTPPANPQSREPSGNANGNASASGNANANANASRAGMSVRDMLGPGEQNNQGNRTNTDSNMLNALNRRAP